MPSLLLTKKHKRSNLRE